MTYHTLSAYGISSGNLEISLVISDLVKDAVVEAVGSFYMFNDNKYINSVDVPKALSITGLIKAPNYYYYRWCIETFEENDT